MIGKLFGRLFGSKLDREAGVEGSLSGYFDVRGDRIAGSVDAGMFDMKLGLEIEVRRRGQLIAACAATPSPHGHSFVFSLPMEDRFTTGELIDETVEVHARNGRGDAGVLKLDGATQLELVRAHLGVPSVMVIDLDLTQGGNAKPYLGGGWSGAERDFTWTDGRESVVSFDAPAEPGKYALRITAGPFLHPPEVTRQDMQVTINGAWVGRVTLTDSFVQFSELKMDAAVLQTAPRVTLRLQHEDATRPSDVSSSKDSRLLAFSVKRISLVRLIGPDA